MTVEEMLGRMTSREVAEWMAFDRLEPIGPIRGDVRAAMICQILANTHRPKGRAAYKLADFMPFERKQRTPAQTPEEMKLAMMRFAASVRKRGA